MNAEQVKKDFPIFNRHINDHRLVYLDNAATTQKPLVVIEAEADFYRHHNANIHRGIHTLSVEATGLYEAARDKVRSFIGAESVEEIVFARNATEGLNLIAQTWGLATIEAGDEILVTEMEHHANLLPWQRLAHQKQAKLVFIPLSADGQLAVNWAGFVSPKTKLVALPQISNVLGVVNPVKEVARQAHRVGAVVVVDAAQSVPHMAVDVQELGVDFLVFSGHKMLGPTGVGVVYGKKELLKNMEPYQVGGEMIREVSYESASWHDLPWKFEAGTPNIAGVIGLAAAIDYLQMVGMDEVWAHGQRLTNYALEQLQLVNGVVVYGPTHTSQRSGVISFNVDGIHAHDVASILDEQGVAIRSGHHCAQPLIHKMGLAATARASFYIYNDESDVDVLIEAIHHAQDVLGGGSKNKN